MLTWHSSDTDFAVLSHGAKFMGSDTSPVNIYLLGNKYRTLVAEQDGVLFRYYRGGTENRRGYGFPLFSGSRDFGKILSLLKRDAASRGVPLAFCLCDENQRKVLDSLCAIRWRSSDGDDDYIYKRESLAQLSGKKLHAKKNFVNRFWRLHAEAAYRPLTKDNLSDAVRVAEQWVEERGAGGADKSELANIRKAAERWEEMALFGGVLYVGEVLVAMTMASAVSPQCIDVHFEKALGDFAPQGAYAAVNQAFAASEAALPYMYVNREEDMAVPGLRKAKESYRPAYKIEKYYGVAAE